MALVKLLQQRTLLVDQGIDPANKFLVPWTIRDQLPVWQLLIEPPHVEQASAGGFPIQKIQKSSLMRTLLPIVSLLIS